MNRRFLILFSMFFLLASCSKTEKRFIKLDVKQPENFYFEISNQGNKTATFSIDINDRGLYSLNKMVDFIRYKYPNMSSAEQVWRFVSDYSRHLDLITKNNWLYDPMVLINSAGGSLCGFRSAVMTNILKYMGEEARSWCIEGHVITEVVVNNKWQVYDPDLGVAYYNEKGEICNFEELCNYPDYISNPIKIKCISNICDSIKATSIEIATMYATKENNNLFNTDYKHFDDNESIKFVLPPGANLSFPLSDDGSNSEFALAVLNLPPQWNGLIEIPLILYDFKGKADITYGNSKINSGDIKFNEIIAANSEFRYQVKIKNNEKGVNLRYYINPLLYFPDSINRIEFIGNNLTSLNVKTKLYNEKNKPEWKYNCSDEFNKWRSFLFDCRGLKPMRVASLYDYKKIIEQMNGCGAFNKFDIDSLKLNKYLDSTSITLEKKDVIFWKKYEDFNYFILSWIEFLKRFR